MDFFISVIIPFLNAERFIEKALLSALSQKEVKEVILINDGSTDESVLIATRLASSDSRIKICHHENKENRGRSASRNLGIKNATQNFIAFLDADDYYLPNRFVNDKIIFSEHHDADGVYNAVGFHFYRKATQLELLKHQIYTVTQKVTPEALFNNLLYGKCGHFHIDGLTVKKCLFEAIGLFNESLIVAEDTELFWKMAIKCRLETGVIDKPVAIRGVHENNIFVNESLYKIYNLKMHEAIAIWCSKNKVNNAIIDDVLKWIWMLRLEQKNKLYQDIGSWARFFLSQPQLLFTKFSIKYFPLIRYRQILFPFFYR